MPRSYASARTDLRRWLDDVRDMGELKTVEEADWNKEIGTLVELNAKARGPALLFDHIKDYPPGFRILTGSMSSAKRLALTLGLPADMEGLDLIRLMKDKMHRWSSAVADFPPVEVEDGVVFENVQEADRVDLGRFPAPLWHEEDGGRYIGTGAACIMRDPDTGWVNLGTYRVMLHDQRSAGMFIAPRHHGRLIMNKYWRNGQPCPVAISLGHHPLILFAGSLAVAAGISEYDYIGRVIGEGVPVVPGRITGLPIPAFSELALEGYMHPGDFRSEGKFGEWPGYYVSEAKPEPVVRVQAVYFRDDPILMGAWPGRPPHDNTYRNCIIKSANLWELLERAGIRGITGIYRPEAGAANLLTIVGIKQMFHGHARQVGTVASQLLSHPTRYLVVVDDDIDVTSLEDVIWAICTRTDPSRSLTIIDDIHVNVLDPMVRSRFDKSKGHTGSCAVIDACKPYQFLDVFPKTAESKEDFKQQVRKKWSGVLRL
ncbi:MAG: UbiD family decarboxylase [Candidatus Binatia bacterium]